MLTRAAFTILAACIAVLALNQETASADAPKKDGGTASSKGSPSASIPRQITSDLFFPHPGNEPAREPFPAEQPAQKDKPEPQLTGPLAVIVVLKDMIAVVTAMRSAFNQGSLKAAILPTDPPFKPTLAGTTVEEQLRAFRAWELSAKALTESNRMLREEKAKLRQSEAKIAKLERATTYQAWLNLGCSIIMLLAPILGIWVGYRWDKKGQWNKNERWDRADFLFRWCLIASIGSLLVLDATAAFYGSIVLQIMPLAAATSVIIVGPFCCAQVLLLSEAVKRAKDAPPEIRRDT